MSINYDSNDQINLNLEKLVTYGLLLNSIILDLKAINVEYDKSGPARTQWDVRRFAARSLKIVIDRIREGLLLADYYEPIEDCSKELRKSFSELPTPSPLIVLLMELLELQKDRVSPLLAHNLKDVGFGPYHLTSRYIQAGAAAAVDALITLTEMSPDPAVDLVVKTLRKKDFKPRGKHYTRASIEDLYRHRTKKKEFEGYYEDWCRRFRELNGTAAALSRPGDPCIKAALRVAIVEQFASLTDVVSYRIAPRP